MPRTAKILPWLALFCAAVPVSARAKVVELFERPGVPRPDYDVRVAALQSDDEVCFSGGLCFKLLGFLNAPQDLPTNLIFDIGSDRVLRISRTRATLDTIGEFVWLYPTFERFGAPVTPVWVKDSSAAGEFVLQANARSRFTLEEFLDGGRRAALVASGRLAAHEIPGLWEKLLHALASFSRFVHIGDARSNNVIYSGSRWELLDFRASVAYIDGAYANGNPKIWMLSRERASSGAGIRATPLTDDYIYRQYRKKSYDMGVFEFGFDLPADFQSRHRKLLEEGRKRASAGGDPLPTPIDCILPLIGGP